MADVAILNINNTDYNIRDEVARNAIPSPADAAPLMDGTAAVGTSTDYAREDHVHPTDTSRQETLVSGTNIKTVNSTSLLGSGNVSVQPTLVSGTNIKTVNGNSLLGSGDLTISDSDQNVTQTNTTGSAAYRVLFSSSANNTTETAGARKSGNLTFNPSTGVLTVSGSVSANGTTLTGNTGTVTSVGITNGGGISVSGSPITGSGNITLSVDNTADTGYLKKKSDTGYNETFRWGYQTNSDATTYPFIREHRSSSSSGGITYYSWALGPVYSSSSSNWFIRANGESDRLELKSGVSIGTDQGSEIRTSLGGTNGTWFIGNQSSQYNGDYGFLGKGSTDLTSYHGVVFNPYEGEIRIRSYANRNGSDTVIDEAKVEKWDSHTTNGNYNLTAATTQAVYPIKIDSRGHISAYGSAVTNIVRTTATQTLTNKTLTSPSISSPVFSGDTIGSTVSGSVSNTSLASGTTSTSLGTFALNAGTWVVMVTFRFASNSSGRRFGSVSTTAGGSAVDSALVLTAAPANGAITYYNVSSYLRPTSSTTYHINAYQNSGSALGVYAYYRCVRII